MQCNDVWFDGRAAIDACGCPTGGEWWQGLPDGHVAHASVQHHGVPPAADTATARDGHADPDVNGRADDGARAGRLRHGQLVGLRLV